MSRAGTTDDSPNNGGQWGDPEQQSSSKTYAFSGKIMLASIVVLFVVVIFLVLIHLYARWYLLRVHRRNHNLRRSRRNRSTRIVFYVDSNTGVIAPTGGLDASVLKSLPLFVYSEAEENMPECAVCLSEFEDGEKGRTLPKCKHSFHTECIDMWFHNHSTCPLCRSPVEAVESDVSILVEHPKPLPETSCSTSPGFPAQHDSERGETVSFTDRRKAMDIRIDVPRRNESAAENEFRVGSPSQGFRSPGSRLLSLKRILSMSRKSPAVSPSSGIGPSRLPTSTESDVESDRHEPPREGMGNFG